MTLEKVKQCIKAMKAFNDEHEQRQRPADKERYHVKYDSPFMYYLWMAKSQGAR